MRRPGFGTVALAMLAAAALAATTGCSDDVTCPEAGSGETLPLVLAQVVEVAGTGEAFGTSVTVTCVSDPLPGTLGGSVNDRALDTVSPASPLGLEASLSDTQIVWVTGTECELEVQIDDAGYATATAVVPGASTATAPASIELGEDLVLSWTDANDADHYRVELSFESASGETTVFERTSLLNGLTLESSVFTEVGTIRGRVFAVSGPFNDGGSAGNVSGDAWGFFTVSYSSEDGTFEVSIEAAG